MNKKPRKQQKKSPGSVIDHASEWAKNFQVNEDIGREGKAMLTGPTSPQDNIDILLEGYRQICISYHAVDDLRTKLLQLLPLATGGGIFLLLNSNFTGNIKEFLVPISVFGFLITVGLFCFELYLDKKYRALIFAGMKMEALLDFMGQFKMQPTWVLHVINEPLAVGIIYSAGLAAWTYVAFVFTSAQLAFIVSSVVFVVCAVGSFVLISRLKA